MKRELPYYLAFAAAPGIGPARFAVLVKHFKTAENLWRAPDKTLEKYLPQHFLKNSPASGKVSTWQDGLFPFLNCNYSLSWEVIVKGSIRL